MRLKPFSWVPMADDADEAQLEQGGRAGRKCCGNCYRFLLFNILNIFYDADHRLTAAALFIWAVINDESGNKIRYRYSCCCWLSALG